MIPGLIKLKNCCYINSSLQALVAVDDLVHFCKQQIILAKAPDNSTTESEFVLEFAHLISSLKNSSASVVNSKKFIYLLSAMVQGFEIQVRQDSHEFISLLLDRLQISLRQLELPDIVQQCFSGRMSENYNCVSCSWDTGATSMPFDILTVPIVSVAKAAKRKKFANVSLQKFDQANLRNSSSTWSFLKQ